MAIVKAKIGEIIYDIITLDEYNANPSFYSSYPNIAIDMMDGYLYPIRSHPNDLRPGFIDSDTMQYFTPPSGNMCPVYSKRNIIDFSKTSSIKDVIEAQAKLASAERSILTTIDNIFVPPISDEDLPEMALLKEAIAKKSIDIDKYEQRFGVA